MTPTLFCFPHSGGGSYHFRELAAALPGWTVTGVDYPSPDVADSLSVEALAAAWVDAHRRALPDRPLLYGQSLGGVVAFEVAVQAEALGLPVAGLVLAASRPSATTAFPIEDDDLLLRWSFEQVRRRPPTNRERDAFAYFAPAIRRDLVMYRAYQPSRSLRETRTLIVAGSEDNICPDLGGHDWAGWLAEVTVTSVEGTHLFHLESPGTVGAALRAWAARPELVRSGASR